MSADVRFNTSIIVRCYLLSLLRLSFFGLSFSRSFFLIRIRFESVRSMHIKRVRVFLRWTHPPRPLRGWFFFSRVRSVFLFAILFHAKKQQQPIAIIKLCNRVFIIKWIFTLILLNLNQNPKQFYGLWRKFRSCFLSLLFCVSLEIFSLTLSLEEHSIPISCSPTQCLW